MTGILSKPEFYKDLSFLGITSKESLHQSWVLEGKLITKITTMSKLKAMKHDMYFGHRILYGIHTKTLRRRGGEVIMKYRGGEAGNVRNFLHKHERVERDINYQLHKKGYLAPLYFIERCQDCNEFTNDYDNNVVCKFYREVYSQ